MSGGWDPCQARGGPKVSLHSGKAAWSAWGPGTVSSRSRHLTVSKGHSKLTKQRIRIEEEIPEEGHNSPIRKHWIRVFAEIYGEMGFQPSWLSRVKNNGPAPSLFGP